jgi:hypothetical protein
VELPKPRVEYVIPDDPVGRRPPAEQPQGAAHLFVLALVSLYYHFAELLRISLLGLVIAVPLVFLFGCLLGGYVPKGGPSWQSYVSGLALIPVFAPLWAGLEYVVLLTVQRLFPKAREALRPFRSSAVYLNVLVAAGVVYFGWSAFSALWNLAVFLVAGELPLSDPFADQALRLLPAALLGTLLFLPLAFAGLDVLASKASFRQAIARSIRFAFSQKRLVASYAIIALTEATILELALAMLPSSAGAPQAGGETSWVGLTVVVGVFLLTLLVGILVKALFYREFVWREREAAAPAAPSEIA